MNEAQKVARAKRMALLAKRREDERKDARDYLRHGDLNGRHERHCVHAQAGAPACARNYDPKPYVEARPDDLTMYKGTGVGALYGLPDTERFLVELAGWNLKRRRDAW